MTTDLWEGHFERKSYSFFFRDLWKSIRKEMPFILKSFPKHYSVLDVGCGLGRTLQIFKECGFYNIYGLDIHKNTDKFIVFTLNILNNMLKGQSFDIVFSDGLLEHFNDCDFETAIYEMCRLSKKYILILQPNHESFIGWLFHLFPNFKAEIPEIKRTEQEYIDGFTVNGFYPVFKYDLHYKQEYFILFRKF